MAQVANAAELAQMKTLDRISVANAGNRKLLFTVTQADVAPKLAQMEAPNHISTYTT